MKSENSSSPPLLDLAKVATLPTVKLSAGLFGLKTTEILSVLDYQRLAAMGREMFTLAAAEELSEEAAVELSKRLDQLTREILIAPPEVHEDLSDDQRMRICMVFIELLQQSKAPMAAGAARSMTTPLTGESSPVDSPDSSAAIPGVG